VPDFPAVAIGERQQPRLVLAVPELLLAVLLVLAGVLTLDPGHVYRGRLVHHDRIATGCSREASVTHLDFPGYVL
jgi:hypothetical protein